MSEASIEIEGLSELVSELETCREELPDQTNLAMKSCARDWRKDVNSKMPGTYSNIPKKWSTKYYYGQLQQIDSLEITNKAPQWHLVENGHRKFDFHGHDTGGFVPGRHYAADTNAEWEDKFPEVLHDALGKVLAKAGFS